MSRLFLFGCLLLMPPIARAQVVLLDQLNPVGGAASAGDVNNDGIPDIALNGTIYSTQGWQQIQTFGAGAGVFGFGDLNADGQDDVYLSLATPGFIGNFVDPATGSVIWGPILTGDPGSPAFSDLDGDGGDDILFIGGIGLGVLNGASGQLDWYNPGLLNGDWNDKCAPLLDDVDGDGVDDLILGEPNTLSFVGPPGAVSIVSGATGAILVTHATGTFGGQFGYTANAIGDVDGDGKRDLCIFEPGYPSFPSTGAVHIISSVTGATLLVRPMPPGFVGAVYLEFSGSLFYGCSVKFHGTVDQDGDGVGDFYCTGAKQCAGIPNNGIVLFSGRTGNVLKVLPPPPGLGAMARYADLSFPPFPDINDDGAPEVLTGSSYQIGMPLVVTVHRYLISFLPTGVSFFGGNCANAPGAEPKIGVSGNAAAGGSLTFNVAGVPPAVNAWLVLGLSNQQWGGHALPLDLSGSGSPGCALLVSPDVIVPAATTPIGPAIAFASLGFTAAATPSLAGLSVYAQWAVENPQGSPGIVSLTRGMKIDFH